MEKSLENITEMLAHHMDAADMRTIVPTLLFIRHLGHQAEAASSQTAWDTMRHNPEGLQLDALIERAREQTAAHDQQLAEAMPQSQQAKRLGPQETKLLIKMIDQLAEDADIGEAYQQILHRFTPSSAQRQGQFFTPPSVAELVAGLIPDHARSVYDPAAGAGTLIIHGHERMSKAGHAATACGQEINPTTIRLARMNLTIRDIAADIREGDTIERDLFPDLKADAVVANPPFNMKFKGSTAPIEHRWKFGAPPPSSANFAWLQHCLHHTAQGGTAVVIMTPSSLQNARGNERKIRQRMIENGNVAAIIALPPKLFATTTVPAAVWVMTGTGIPGRSTLMVDAQQMGHPMNRRQNELSPDEIKEITDRVNEWQLQPDEHVERPGVTRAVTAQDMRQNEFSLSPTRYIMPPPPIRDESGIDPIQAALDDLRVAEARSREASKRMWEMLNQLGYSVPPNADE